jgi:hypothetical protein
MVSLLVLYGALVQGVAVKTVGWSTVLSDARLEVTVAEIKLEKLLSICASDSPTVSAR